MIRLATPADIPCLVELGCHFRDGTDYQRHVGGNPERMRALGEKLVAGGGLLVSERDGTITGMLGFIVYPHFISGEVVAGEVFWWVEPAHRGDGLKLLREAERRCREAGATRMQMIAPTDQVATVYQRLGYEFVEATYQRTL